MAVVEVWETLKHAIESYTGLSAPIFFTVVAVAAAFYYVVSGFLAPPPPPPARKRDLMEDVEPLPPPVQLGEINEEELLVYDGSDSKKPLLMAIKGQIYDVTQSRMFYGPGGPYALFAGRDASRALAKMSFEQQDLTGDISSLGPFELEALQDWEYKFMSKYVKVGTIKKTVPVSDVTDGNKSETTETPAQLTKVTENQADHSDRTEDTPADAAAAADDAFESKHGGNSLESKEDIAAGSADETKVNENAPEGHFEKTGHSTEAKEVDTVEVTKE